MSAVIDSRWVPVNEFPWPEPAGLFEMTCKNHPTALYYSKHPGMRSLHLIRTPQGLEPEERTHTGECKCPFSDLIVKAFDDLSEKESAAW